LQDIIIFLLLKKIYKIFIIIVKQIKIDYKNNTRKGYMKRTNFAEAFKNVDTD